MRSTAYSGGCLDIFDILFILPRITTVLLPFRLGWLLVLSLYMDDYLQIDKCVSF